MKTNYIALSIPIFFILIGVELLIGYFQKRKYYRLNDSINNLSLGITSQISGIFLKTILFFGYLFLFEQFGKSHVLPNKLWVWIVLFFCVDFCYYWFHRMSHEVNAMWAAHIVHHQSEEYNLSVALRQSSFQGVFSSLFYLPLAVIGFDPIMFATIASFNTLYQFWIHTKLIGKLGPLEWVFNTPSHHRVHHGSNPKYIDKNHAGSLIIWDRMFGTFQEEEEEVIYGITTPLKSWNPVWANLHYWVDLFDTTKKTSQPTDKVMNFLKPPGWFPNELGGFQHPKEIDKATYAKYDGDSKKWHVYIFMQFVVVLGVATGIIFGEKVMTTLQLTLVSAYVVYALVNLGAMFEARQWVRISEYLRFPLTIALSFAFYGYEWFLLIFTVSVMYAVGAFVWFWRKNKA